MDTQTIPRHPQQDKPFELHVPSFTTMTCLHCGAPIAGLEEWLNTECPGAAAELREAA